MSRKTLRFPMFLKFLVGCFTLAALLIVGGTLVVKNETRFRNRGNFMAKQLRRYHGYEERVGRGMTGTLEVLASSRALAAAMSPPPAAEGVPAVETVDQVAGGMFERLDDGRVGPRTEQRDDVDLGD